MHYTSYHGVRAIRITEPAILGPNEPLMARPFAMARIEIDHVEFASGHLITSEIHLFTDADLATVLRPGQGARDADT